MKRVSLPETFGYSLICSCGRLELEAFLAHTWTGVIHHVKVNGEEFGEMALDAAICGAYGVPLFAITGDDAVCREANFIKFL